MGIFNNRRTLLLGSGLLLAATATVAIAGNGVGGVFNLGVVNTVNGRTDLQGSTSTQSLRVVNASNATGSAAISGQANRGIGVLGSSTSRMGVRALATNTSGVNYGIYATTASRGGLAGFFQNAGTTADPTLGSGVRGLAAGATSNLFAFPRYAGGGEFAGPNGVIGISSDANLGAGVVGYTGAGDYGVAGVATSPGTYAGFFQNRSPSTGTGILSLGAGVTGAAIPASISGHAGGEFVGYRGIVAVGTGGVGVYGQGSTGVYGSGSPYGVYSNGHARVVGNLSVTGALTKGSGTFKIDHPLDPANKYLSHSFVESPDMMNIYNGNVVTDASGEAIVELPGYFEALNRDPRYQLTVIGSFAAAQISQEVSGNRFTIRTSEPGVKVSWQATGIRQDAFAEAHPVIVEEEKALADRGRYLHPAELGMPLTLGIEASVASGAGVGETRTLQ